MMGAVVEAFLASYGAAGVKALKVVIKYLRWREERFGKRGACVTYEGLRKYITYSKINMKFTTLERALRRLAEGEDAPIKRIKKGRNAVIFCLNHEHPIIQYLMEAMEA